MFKLMSLSMIAFMMYSLNSPVNAQTVAINLNPKESKVIENNYLWALQANCSIQCSDSSHKISISLVKNKGAVNGKNLSVGQTTSFAVHNHDSISVSAEPGAKVNLRNLGTDAVHASCST